MPSNASPSPNTPCSVCTPSKPASSPTASTRPWKVPPSHYILERPELANRIDIALEQHRAYWLAFGFNRFTRQSNIAATFLRFQAQAERLHRRAVEDFHRLLKLRDQLPPEKYEEPNEPKNEPISTPQPTENTAPPVSAPPISQTNEPTAERTRPRRPPATSPNRDAEPRLVCVEETANPVDTVIDAQARLSEERSTAPPPRATNRLRPTPTLDLRLASVVPFPRA